MKRNTLSVLIILFTVLLSLFACRKNIEFYIEGKEAPRSSRVESAKVWRSQRINRSISRQSEVLRPFWDDSWVVRTNDGKEFLVVPAPERKMDNKDFSLRRFFVFTTLGNFISDGKIVEFLGEKWNVEDHLNLLLKNIGKEGIDDFNGLISEYDINYRLIRNFAYKSGKITNLQSKIQTTAFDSVKGMASMNSIGGCSPVSPIYVGFPPTRCSGAMVTYREDWVAEDGCLTSLVYTYISHTCPEKGGGSGSGGSGSGSGSSSGGGNPPYGGNGEANAGTEPSSITFVLAPNINLEQYFGCFNTVANAGAIYSVELRADLPVPSNPAKLVNIATMRSGHAFITVTKSNGGVAVSQSFGFYPSTSLLSITAAGVGSIINDDGGHSYNASIAMNNITAANFQTVLEKAKYLANNMSYDINDYNCTDYAINVFNSIRPNNQITVPNWIGPTTGVDYGRTPNGLYLLLAQKKSYGDQSVSISPSNSPAKRGPCN